MQPFCCSFRFGYEDKLLVMKAHKHHVLADNEAMIDEGRKGDSDSIVSTPAPVEEIVNKGVLPSVIVLGEGKRFIPITHGRSDLHSCHFCLH